LESDNQYVSTWDIEPGTNSSDAWLLDYSESASGIIKTGIS